MNTYDGGVRRLPVRPAACCSPGEVRLPRRGRAEADLLAGLRALADPTRLRLVRLLAASPGPVCVCDLVTAAGVGQPTVSHHLSTLRRAGLADGERRGVWSYWRLRPAGLARLRAALGDLGAAPGREGS
jgi:ArsR family transcriptional regulator